MTDTTRFAPGEWNFTCDLCGGDFKSSTAEKTWDGYYVCQGHKERRNPQDFVRGVSGEKPLPWSRPGVDTFVVSNFRILQENGSALLLENGSYLLRT